MLRCHDLGVRAYLAAPARRCGQLGERVKTVAMVRHRGLLEEEEHLDGLASVQAEAIQKPLSLAEPPEGDSK
jgi:hypothetical protein